MNYEEWTGLKVYRKNYPIRDLRKKILINFLKTLPKGKFLDVGFYPGDVCFKAKTLGFDVYGVDVVKENIKKARKNYKGIHFIYADAEKKLPFKNNFFDVIWAGDLIEHVRDTITLFKEFNRVLKKDGYLILSTPYHSFLKMLAISIIALEKHFHPEHRHIRFYTPKSLRYILNKYGFKIIKEYYLGRIKFLHNNMLFISKKSRDLDLKKIPEMLR